MVRESRDDDGCFEQGNVLGPRDAFEAGPATRADSRRSAPTSDGNFTNIKLTGDVIICTIDKRPYFMDTFLIWATLHELYAIRVNLVINLIMGSGEGTGRSEPDDGGLFRNGDLLNVVTGVCSELLPRTDRLSINLLSPIASSLVT